MNLPVPANEGDRLKALKEYNLLDTLPQERFDRLTKLASIICESPIAVISLIDHDRQWFKSKVGIDAKETAREVSFCQYTIMEDIIFEVPDASQDLRFKNNPLVTSDPKIRFYAGYPLVDPNGFALGTLCVIDSAPKKLSENQKEALKILAKDIMEQIISLRRNEEWRKLEKLFMLSIDMICIAGTDGYFKKINPAFKQTLGWSKKELLSQPFFSFIHPDDIEKTSKEVEKLSEGQTTLNFINRYRTSNNSYRLLQWVANPDPVSGELFAIARDITEEKQAEENLKIAKNEAERARALQEQFLANMSHEIRTPMNAIVGFSSLLVDSELNKQQKELVSNINVASENLLGIINDLLDISKIDAGMMEIEKNVVHLPTLVEGLRAMMAGKAKLKELDFSLNLNPDVPEFIIGDSVRLSQVLVNLVSNAIKFTANGFVKLETQVYNNGPENLQIRFTVSDSGIGVAKKNLDIIFERFKQESSETTRKYGGTGLGLNIVKNIINLMGGKISINSEPGNGSEFTVIIPFEKCSQTEIEKYVAQQDKANTNQQTRVKTLKVLLVEDNPLNQKYCSLLLNQSNFSCSIANNGKEALQKLSEENFDIILMDIQMPEMDGFEATNILRNELKNNIPVIAITANATEDERKKCFRHGMNGYISKPFKPNDFHDKIAEVLKYRIGDSIPGPAIKKNGLNGSVKKLVDVNFLKDQVKGNIDGVKELIQIFVDDVPREINKLANAIGIKDFVAIEKTAHRLISSFAVIGIVPAIELLKLIELNSTRQKDIKFINDLYQRLNIITDAAKIQIQELSLN
jgi:PAS domain S-box-containing protein